MLNVLCFWFGALLAGLDSLILAVFAQMKSGPLHVRNRGTSLDSWLNAQSILAF